MSESAEGRLRPRPAERFAGAEHLLGINEALEQLRNEPGPTSHGHRQQTLYHDARATVIVFAFDAGGGLAEHKANGTVIIQALEGQITVTTEEHEHELSPGGLLVLAPNVRHSVAASRAAAMLLIVCLDPSS